MKYKLVIAIGFLNIFYYLFIIKINSNILPGSQIKQDQRSLYLVNSSKCRIPRMNPFAADIMALYNKQMPMVFENCTNETDLITVTYNTALQRYILNVDLDFADRLSNSNDSRYSCFYQAIERHAEKDDYLSKPPVNYFTQDHIVPKEVRAIVVGCHIENNKSHVLQKDAYSLIQYEPRLMAGGPSPAKQSRKPSVIILGIDSMSRNNLHRTMPKINEYLTRSGWYELQGFNKIADNTLPNLLATLSGFTPKSAEIPICDIHEKGCLDQIPFIWKYFKNASYVTAFGEDVSKISTFNYFKPGFRDQPTDYYLRPNIKAFESMLKKIMCKNPSVKCCIGRRIVSSYVYDFCLEFVRRYLKDRPLFGLFWVNSFSHDNFAMPTKMQAFVLQYLNALEKEGAFEESIMIFMSDHGARFGKIRFLPNAYLEESLPMMYIYLPPWFSAQYPEFAQALRINTNRLTSNYDLHNTLKHIIELGGTPDGPTLPMAYDCPTCQSLFYPVPEERSCANAGIPAHFCTCEPFIIVNATWTSPIAPKVLEQINQYLQMQNLSSICRTLSLKETIRVSMKIDLNTNFKDLPTLDVATYRVEFKVKEQNASFSATVKFNNITENVDLDVETISRMNRYNNDATCIKDDTFSKFFCVCK